MADAGSVHACAQRPGAAARESLWRDRAGGLTVACVRRIVAAPALFAHSVVAVVVSLPLPPLALLHLSTSACDVQRKNWLRVHDENVRLLTQRDAAGNKLGMLCGECGIPIQKSGRLRCLVCH